MAGRRSTSTRDDASGEPPRSTPKDIARIEFGRRLNRLLVKASWNQSDFARKTKAHTPEGVKGVSRALVSKYINGKVLPSAVNLQIICETLNVTREELLPPVATPAMADDGLPSMSMRETGDGRVWLSINKVVGFQTALEILNLLKTNETK